MGMAVEIEHLAGVLTRELHIDIPGLKDVVLEAVSEAHREFQNPRLRAESVAVGIVDRLACRGTPIDDYLETRAAFVWEGAVRDKYLMALQRCTPPGALN